MNLVPPVYAVQQSGPIVIKAVGDFTPIVDFGKLISGGISLMMLIAAIATFFYLVWGGLEWITSGGEKAGTESAKSKITNAFIGLFIVFSAWAIMAIFEKFFNVCILNCPLNFPSAVN